MDPFQENVQSIHFPSTAFRNLSSSSSAFYSASQSPFLSPKSATFCASTEEPPQPSTAATIAKLENVFPSVGIPKTSRSSTEPFHVHKNKGRCKKAGSFDVYIGFHCRKPLLLRFTNWLKAELEAEGLACFATDRSLSRNTRARSVAEKAMDGSTVGVVIVTAKSFRNPYMIEELRFFSGKKNLVPVYFDVGPDHCLARDIIEKRGEAWERHGGELWLAYGGLEEEWMEAVGALLRSDERRLDAHDGRWRECITRAITLLALRLGRRSIVDRLSERVADKDEFPFPRNEAFVGRTKELSELELMLFGDASGKNSMIAWGRRRPRGRSKRRPEGIACVSGESGIGKTELLLEFAYRFHQRYKMVLWIGGETRYIRQNYMSLRSFLDIGSGDLEGKGRPRRRPRPESFEQQEEEALSTIRDELAMGVPYLIIIDNLENERDWWDHKHVTDLLPRFGGPTHIIVSTRLSRVLNVDPLRLSYVSGLEAMSLMLGAGGIKDRSVEEIKALRVMEEKLSRLTLGLAVVGSVLSELRISPVRLLETTTRTPSRVVTWGGHEAHSLRKNSFLLQLFEVCFSIFDRADGAGWLSTRMAVASGWFAPAPIPVSVLSLASQELPEKRLWRKALHWLSGGCRRSPAADALSLLVRFNIARACTAEGCVRFGHLVKLYSRRRGVDNGSARAVVRAVVALRSPEQHLWAACFLFLGFGKDPIVVELRAAELVALVREVAVPLAVQAFTAHGRCRAAVEVLRLCTEALEAAEEGFGAAAVDGRVGCWGAVRLKPPCRRREVSEVRARVLEVRAKLMVRGGQLEAGSELMRKAVLLRSSICGEDHPETVAARKTLTRIIGISVQTSEP